jgi:hypothetical protein
MRWYHLAAGIAALSCLLLLAYCQHRSMVAGLPPRIVCASEAEAVLKAGAGAVPVRGTGSMVPFIPANPANPQSIVAYAAPSGKPYSELKKGDLVVYYADWAKGNVIHQAAQKDGKGWIMSGLGNKQSESFARVTEKDFFFHVEAVYVWNL